MRESFATLVSQTANGVVDLIVANIPNTVMQSLELEERGPGFESPKESETPDAPWGYQICPHSRKRITHSRTHLFAVAGLLITGALIIYMTALHMGFLGSEDAAAALFSTFNQTSPCLNITNGCQSLGANSSVGVNSSLDANPSLGANSSVGANSSLGSNSSFGANSSTLDYIGANSSALDYTNVTVEISPVASIPAAAPVAAGPEYSDISPSTRAPQVYYQNMSETWHTMSDKKLLQKATSGGLLQKDSSAVKLAFMFMARGPLPFAPLWERYFRGHEELYSIYIHAHPDYVPTLSPVSPFFGRFVPSKVVQWGKLSVYEAERRLLGNALLDPTNSWFLLLSESCIPLYSFPETYAYFNHSPGVSFIESYADSSRRGQGRLYRGKYKAMEPEITASNFRKGSQWFQITRDLALEAARDSPEYAKFEKYFCKVHPVCYIDEHFLPTLAWIVRPNAIAFRTLTYFTFRGQSPHPKKFAKWDTDRNLIRWFREGRNCTYNGMVTSKCYLFVRKFDPNALEVLLDLAGAVMGIP